ncbi:MAG: protein kinase [Blastocatellia bacterium]|nr:protein kinase [Blastocatellia bacterium]
MIGETISHYRILERLGAGGMGEVYKAEDARLQRQVALKLMLGDEHQTELMRGRFLREARAASAISHPNIATIYEIDEVEREGRRYSFIVMEYVEGRILKEMIGAVSLMEALEIIEQMVDGLAAAHDRGIVHRDIKPSNVMVTAAQLVKILDFGVAKYSPPAMEDDATSSLLATDVMKTVPGTVVGTYTYMSPEQARGLEVDHRSDIFSLGVLSYELITGRQPFTGKSVLAVVDSILHGAPLPLGRFNSYVNGDLERFIHRMLEKSRDLRYQSLRDAAVDLERVRVGVTRSSGQVSYETNVGYGTQLLSGASRDSGTFTLRKRTGKSVAVLSFNNVTRRSEDDWLGVGIAETVTSDLKNVEGISVIGRERIYEALRHWNEDLRADFDEKMATRIGQEIGARWIIGGAYQRLGDLLRITARLVEVDTGEIAKTVKIDGMIGEVFALQDKIVYELSRNLDLSLRSGEREAIDQPETQVIEAYEAYVKGQELAFTGTPEGITEAIELARKAIALDPGYAHAYAGLAYALTIKGQFTLNRPLIEEAVEYAQKAIELRPNLADSYSILGFAFTALDREDDAIGALKRALAFAPNDGFVRAGLGRAYFVGKGMFHEAAAEYDRALENPGQNNWIASALAHVLLYTGDFRRAEEMARISIQSQEQSSLNHEGIQVIGSYMRLGQALYLQKRYDEAIVEFRRERDFLQTNRHALRDRVLIEVHQKLVCAYVRLGRMNEARAEYEQVLAAFQARLEKGADDPFTRYYIACAAAMMGETDAALDHLRIAIEGRRHFNVARARVESDLDGLRVDARFAELVAGSR